MTDTYWINKEDSINCCFFVLFMRKNITSTLNLMPCASQDVSNCWLHVRIIKIKSNSFMVTLNEHSYQFMYLPPVLYTRSLFFCVSQRKMWRNPDRRTTFLPQSEMYSRGLVCPETQQWVIIMHKILNNGYEHCNQDLWSNIAREKIREYLLITMTFWDNHTRNTQRKKDMNQIIYTNSLKKELISLLPIKFPQTSRLKKHLH